MQLLLLPLYLLGVYSVSAQKVLLQSMPEQNRYAFNSAYAGLEASLDVTAWGREQWTGVPGGPSNLGLNAHMPLYALHGAIGMRVLSDEAGPFRYQSLDLGYAYIQDANNYLLSVGANFGWQGIRFDGSDIRTLDGIYTGGAVDHQDPAIANSDLSSGIATLSLGVYYVRDQWEGGLSVERLSIGSAELLDAPLGFDWAPSGTVHAYFTTGWTLTDLWDIDAHVYGQYDTYHLQSMMKAVFTYDGVMIGGVGWRGYSDRSAESILLTIGYVVDSHLSLHYSYDLGIGGLAQVSNGSHEVVVRYNLNKTIGRSRPRVIGNPRVLR